MCIECGCGLPPEDPAKINGEPNRPRLPNDPEHDHDHPHGGHHHHHEHGDEGDHTHPHEHEHTHGDGPSHSHPHSHAHGEEGRRTLEVRRSILEKNDRLAERNRGFFRARGLFVLNVLSSPGSGKTTLLRETIRALAPEVKVGVVVGDLATDNDALRLRETSAPVIQVTTGTVCHLDAEMVARALGQLDLTGLGLLIIENVGNLVCPASYDLGEDLRVVLLSVTEGEDKPLKYPPIFQSAGAVVLSKIDLAAPCGFDRALALANLHRAAPAAPVFETSARTGAGMAEWKAFLVGQVEKRKTENPLAV